MTQRKKLPEKSSIIHDSIVNGIEIPVLVIDKNFRSLQLNRKASQTFKGVSGAESLCELMEESDARRFKSAFRRSLQTGSEKQLNIVIKNKIRNVKMFPAKSKVTIICDHIKNTSGKNTLPNKTILDTMGDSYFLTDCDLTIIDANNALCKWLGYSRKELIGMNAAQFDAQLSARELKKKHQQAANGHVIFDTKFTNRQGETSDVEVNMFLLKVDGKKYYGSVGRDVTEYKKIQSALEKSNEKLTQITNAANDALWEINLATGERWANEIHQRLYGLKKGDPMPDSKIWERHIHPKQRKKIAQSLGEAILKKQPYWNAEYWFKIGEKSWIYIYDRTLLHYNKDRALVRMMGSMVDVTELKTAQEELKTQRNLSESIINSLPGIFYLIDKEEKFLKWNKNFETITGFTSGEISNMKPADFFYNRDSHKLTEKMEEVFRKGWAEMEGTLITKSGEGKPYYLSGWRTTVAGEECLIGTGMDLSEIRKAQESVKRMEQKIAEQKIQDQKVISRAIIAAQEKERNHIGRELHDNVNQLLAGTRLYLTMGAKKQPQFSEVIRYPLELLDNSIQEIRALTHRHISPAKDMSLKQLAEGITDLLKTASIECKLDYALDVRLPDNLMINIYRILQEEANNILKHSKAKNVLCKIHSRDATVYITTIDDGKGFDINQQREGIGISNIHNRVESYNGTIEITTSKGKGCRIDIEIPIPDYMQLNKADGHKEAADEMLRSQH